MLELFLTLALSLATEREAGESGGERWNEIKAWLDDNYPAHLPLLNAGAERSKIAQVEVELGYAFPAHVTQVFLMNDGESTESQGLFGTWRLLPLNEQVREISGSLNDYRFEKGMFHPLMISGGGDYYGFEPGSEKMFEWNHEIGLVELKAASFDEFLKDFADGLKNGQFVKVEGIRGLVDRDEL